MGFLDKFAKNDFAINQADYTKPINWWKECSGFNSNDFKSHYEGNKLHIVAEKDIAGYKKIKFCQVLDVDRNYYDISRTSISVMDGLMNVTIPLAEHYKGIIKVM